MPSFDIVSKIDVQKLDNAINVAIKELANRFDFHGSKTNVELDKKTLQIHVLTENDMRLKAVEGIIIGRMVNSGEMAIILVEQHAHQILPLTRQALVLERGRVVYAGESDALRADRGQLDKWLGVGSH